jgi:hypothetical protein
MAFQKHNPKAKEVIFEVEPVRVDPVKIEPVKVEIKPLNEPVRIEPPQAIPNVVPLAVDGNMPFNQLEKLKEEKIENTRVKRRRTAPRKRR